MRLGSLCVSFFFVLSGFLITSLLLDERRITGDISVSRFYARRILRIWPLYFLIVFIGFFIIPLIPAYDFPFPGHSSARAFFWEKFSLYMLFSPHIASAIFPSQPYAGVLWSVGVEEWFYIGWPLLILVLRKRALIFMLIFIIISMLFARIIVAVFIVKASYSPDIIDGLFKPLSDVLGQLRFDCMAFGALAAIGLRAFRGSPSLAIVALFSKQMQFFVFSFLGYCLYFGRDFSLLDQCVYSILFAWVIINISSNSGRIITLDSILMRWLGRISYGLYCFNWITIVTTILIIRAVFPRADTPVAQICMQGLAIALTILVAQLSYWLLERPFLRLKHFVSPVEIADS